MNSSAPASPPDSASCSSDSSLRSTADVATDRPERYAKQLVAHLGRKTEMVAERGGHTMHFPPDRGVAATGFIGTADGAVRLEVDAADPESLATVQDVLGRHLEKFGAKDGLEVVWN